MYNNNKNIEIKCTEKKKNESGKKHALVNQQNKIRVVAFISCVLLTIDRDFNVIRLIQNNNKCFSFLMHSCR